VSRIYERYKKEMKRIQNKLPLAVFFMF